MKTELFIYSPNTTSGTQSVWNQIELMEDISVPLTFNIADIADFTKKNSSYSKTITIPGTKANNDIFKHIYNISSYGSFIMNKSYKCYILFDTQPGFEGSFELTSCKIIGYNKIINYEGLVYSDTADLFATISDNLLRGNDDSSNDLDFSEYNHILNEINVRNSLYISPGSGYTYIPIDKTGHWYKTLPEANLFNLDELTSCIFIKEIWDKIFEKYGFTYTSTILNSDRFKRLIYPSTDRWLSYTDTEVSDNSSSMGSSMSSNLSFTITTTSPTPTIQDEIYIGVTFSQGANQCFNEVTGEFIAEIAGYYNVKAFNELTDAYLNVNLGIPFNAPVHNYYKQYVLVYARTIKVDTLGVETLVEDLNGNPMEHTFLSWNSPSTTNPPGLPAARYTVFSNSQKHLTISNSEYNIEGGYVYLNIGDKVRTEIRGYITPAGSGAPSYDWFITGDVEVDITLNAISNSDINELRVELDDRITDNCVVPVTQILHKEKQADFLNSIIKMFNLYIEPIGPKSFRIEPRDTYYQINTTAIDWTNKVDIDKEITIESNPQYRGALKEFKYKDDVDTFNTTYKDATGKQYGELIIPASDTSNKNQYKIEVIFAPTPGGNISSDSSMQVSKIFKVSDNGEIDENAKFKPRILYWAGQKAFKTSSNDVWFIRNNQGEYLYSFPVYHYPCALHIDNVYGAETFDLNFGACDWYWFDLNGTWITWNNICNLYYANLLAELDDTNTRLVTMNMVLNQKDIQELNFYRPIFIDGIHYKLNKISDWAPEKLAKVELFKSNNFNLIFTGKKPRPSLVRPIGFTNILTNQGNVIDLFDGNSTNNTLDIDIFDANFDVNNIDIIDANEGFSIGTTINKYNIDLIDPSSTTSKPFTIESALGISKASSKINYTRKIS